MDSMLKTAHGHVRFHLLSNCTVRFCYSKNPPVHLTRLMKQWEAEGILRTKKSKGSFLRLRDLESL